jgi:inositol transport system substrate-binding protein
MLNRLIKKRGGIAMKKIISILLMSILLVSLLSACGSDASDNQSANTSDPAKSEEQAKADDSTKTDKKFKIGFANIADTDVYCKFGRDVFIEQAEARGNYEVIATDADLKNDVQLAQIETLIAQKVDAIVVIPVDYAGVVPGIQAANKAGIPIISLIIDAKDGDFTFVGSSNKEAGIMQGEFLAETLPENAQVLYMEGTPGLDHSKLRKEGFHEVMSEKRSDIKILASQPADYYRDKAMALMENWMQAYPEFDAVIAANDQMALGAIQALKGADRLEGVQVVGIDATEEACATIKTGEMKLSVFQDAENQAKACLETLVSILEKGEEAPEEVIVPFKDVTQENVDEFIKMYEDRKK